jgi:hypothetical protein
LEEQATAEEKAAFEKDLAEWVEKNNVLYTVLASTTEGLAFSLVTEFATEQDGLKAWNRLLCKYESDGLTRQLSLVLKLLRVELTEDGDADEFVSEINIIHSKLLNLGVELPLVVLLAILMNR